MASLLLALCAAAAPRSAPPLRCLDASGQPSPDALKPLRVGETIERPELVHRVKPVWPDNTRYSGGAIVIESIIDRRGRICAARLLKGRGPWADASLAAVKQWKFKPAKRNGRPMAVFYYLTVHFCPH